MLKLQAWKTNSVCHVFEERCRVGRNVLWGDVAGSHWCHKDEQTSLCILEPTEIGSYFLDFCIFYLQCTRVITWIVAKITRSSSPEINSRQLLRLLITVSSINSLEHGPPLDPREQSQPRRRKHLAFSICCEMFFVSGSRSAIFVAWGCLC